MLERAFDKVLDITANRRFDQQFAIHQARKSLIEAGVADLEQEVEAQDSPDKTAQRAQSEAVANIDLREQTYELLQLHLVREPSFTEKRKLENKGFDFFPIREMSLGDFVGVEGNYFWSGLLSVLNHSPQLRDYRPPEMELALNPTQLFLPNSFNKPRRLQLEMIDHYSKIEIEPLLPGAKAIMLPASAYAQADRWISLRKKSQVLFKTQFAQALDNTPNDKAAAVGRRSLKDTLGIENWHTGFGRDHVGAVPAIVFLKQ